MITSVEWTDLNIRLWVVCTMADRSNLSPSPASSRLISHHLFTRMCARKDCHTPPVNCNLSLPVFQVRIKHKLWEPQIP